MLRNANFLEVKPSQQATQCDYKCESGKIYKDKEICVDPSSCADYLSSNGQFCVQSCSLMLEIIDDEKYSPKTCKKYPQGQYHQAQPDKSVSALSTLGDINLTPTQKSTLKSTFQQVTFDLEKQIGQVLSSPSFKADQIYSLLTEGVKTLKTSILDYLDKLTSYDTATNIQKTSDKIYDQNQLLLGSNKVQIVAEKKKSGNSFKLKFNLQDLIANSAVSLQSDEPIVPKFSNNSDNSNIFGAGIGDATNQTYPKMTAMQVTYLVVNPNCLKFPVGLTTKNTKTSGGRFRNLQSQT
ncbi:hypothetical protein ABPG72_008581 [Tetrahymena utriculariae]